MIQKALRRAGTSWKIFFVAAALFCVGVAGSTTALFTAEVTNTTATYAGGYVGSPGSAAAAGPQGAEMTVTWTTPDTTGVQGYAVMGTNMGTTATACPSSSTVFPVTITTLAAPAATYTATNAASQTDDGDYYCYQVRSYYTTNSWYGTTNANAQVLATRIGLWATTAALANNNNTIARNDTITLTFNQAVTASAPTVWVCNNTASNPNTVRIGASSCTSSTTIGVLQLSGKTITGGTTSYATTITGSGTTTITIKLTTNTNTNESAAGTASWTFTPSGSLMSVTPATTEAPACNTCTISASSNF